MAVASKADVRRLERQVDEVYILVIGVLQVLVGRETVEKLDRRARTLATDRRYARGFPLYRLLNAKATSALYGLGCLTLEELAETLTRDQVAGTKGVGPKSMQKLDEAMAERGLVFATNGEV
jgi:hypothetical protein